MDGSRLRSPLPVWPVENFTKQKFDVKVHGKFSRPGRGQSSSVNKSAPSRAPLNASQHSWNINQREGACVQQVHGTTPDAPVRLSGYFASGCPRLSLE